MPAKRCYLSLIVKGNRHEAAKAAAAHGVPFAFKRELRAETVGYVGTQQLVKVARWFSADSDAPYPKGSLLYYREVCK